MKRNIEKQLIEWKKSPFRKPLIIRGARQVGKSHTIEAFGRSQFDEAVIINLEKQQELHSCFIELDPQKILNRLEITLNRKITPGKTFLFLDEIQICPQAILALRYFKEEVPDLHVIAAGSLIEFILDDEEFSFPVGRVEFLNMKPLSFSEYLEAMSQTLALDWIHSIDFETPFDQTIHQHLLKQVKEYFLIGGMPEAVHLFSKTESFQATAHIQTTILDTYRLDFGKYSKKTQHHYLQNLFERAPDCVGKHFKWSNIDPEAPNPARDYKTALKKLYQADIFSHVHATSANGLPLCAEKKEKTFKILYLDIGLLQHSLDIAYTDFFESSLIDIHRGTLAEQFVGQELLAYMDPQTKRNLYYWENPDRSSTAEIDFLTLFNGHILPIEVKSGVTGRLKSLRQFIEKKQAPIGIRISEKPLSFENQILSIPFYLISQLHRLLTNSRENRKDKENFSSN